MQWEEASTFCSNTIRPRVGFDHCSFPELLLTLSNSVSLCLSFPTCTKKETNLRCCEAGAGGKWYRKTKICIKMTSFWYGTLMLLWEELISTECNVCASQVLVIRCLICMGKGIVQAEHSVSSLCLTTRCISIMFFVQTWNTSQLILYFANPMMGKLLLTAISYNVAVLKFVQVMWMRCSLIKVYSCQDTEVLCSSKVVFFPCLHINTRSFYCLSCGVACKYKINVRERINFPSKLLKSDSKAGCGKRRWREGKIQGNSYSCGGFCEAVRQECSEELGGEGNVQQIEHRESWEGRRGRNTDAEEMLTLLTVCWLSS